MAGPIGCSRLIIVDYDVCFVNLMRILYESSGSMILVSHAGTVTFISIPTHMNAISKFKISKKVPPMPGDPESPDWYLPKTITNLGARKPPATCIYVWLQLKHGQERDLPNQHLSLRNAREDNAPFSTP